MKSVYKIAFFVAVFFLVLSARTASAATTTGSGIKLQHHMTQSLKQPFSGPCCAYAYGIGLSIVLKKNVDPMQFYYDDYAHFDYGHVGDYSSYNAGNIYKSLLSGNPVMLHYTYSTSQYSSEHWVLIIGINGGVSTDKISYGDFIIIDPATGTERSLKDAWQFTNGTVRGIKMMTGGTPIPAPVQPNLSVIQTAPDTLDCSWKKIDGANQYFIEVKDSAGKRVEGQWTKYLNWQFSNISAGTYTVRIDVLASNSFSMGEESKKVTVSVPSPIVSNGTYHIVSKRGDGMSVSVYNQSADARANIELSDVDPETDTGSLINIENLSNGYCKLTVCSSGKVLDCEGAKGNLGTNIIQDNDSGNANQQWYIKSAGDGWFYLMCKCNHRYMDVNANNWNVQMWEGNGTDAQKFKFIASDPSATQSVEDGNYYILSTVDTSYCIDVDGNSFGDNANISLYKLLRHDNQVFGFTYLGNGYYRIINKQSKKALEAGTSTSRNVFQNSWNGSDAQKWIVKDVGNNTFSMVNKETGLYLDLTNREATNSKNIQVFVGNGTPAQQWYLASETSVRRRIRFNLQGGTVEEPFASYPISRFNTVDSDDPGELVIYNNSGRKYGPHPWWIEAAVDAGGKVIAIKELKSESVLTVPNEGFVISGLASGSLDGASFTGKLKNGDYVGYDVNSMIAYAYHDNDSYLINHKYINEGSPYGVLPVPKKEGYYFDGWYTEAEGGNKVSASSAYVTSELFAHWREKDSSAPVASTSKDNHTYELYDLSMSWTEAKAFCEKKGGHLVCITSAEENDCILDLAQKGTKGFYAIGAESEGTPGTWRWVTGEEFAWKNWDTQYAEGNTPGESYAFLISIENPPNKQSGEWIDSPDKCQDSNYYYYGNGGFICEYEGQIKDISDCTITVMNDLFVYDGTEKKPGVTVQLGDTVLNEADHYEIGYKDNIHAGEATIVITGKNQYKGSAEKTFKIEKAEQLLDIEEYPEELEENASSQINASGIGDITYASSDEDVAAVDAEGLLTGKKAGNATITVTAAGDADYAAADQTIEITVVHKEELIEGQNATCTEDGLSDGKKCSICGEILEEQQVIKALGHTEEIVESRKATCTEDGLTEWKKCSVCGETIEEPTTINAFGHTEEIIKGKPATCTEEGLTDGKKCSVCGEILEAQAVIDAAGHQFGEWETVESGSCEGAGSEKRTCKVCGVTEAKNLNPEGHIWSEDFTIDKPASCTEEGSKSIHCLKCDAVKDSTVIQALGHDYGEWVIIEEASCTEDGSREKKCGTCGDIVTEIIPAGHQWESAFTIDKPATCTEEGSKSIHCNLCGEKKDARPVKAAGHVWEKYYTVDKEATEEEEGSASIHCEVCGEIQEGSVRAIEKLPKKTTPTLTPTPTATPTPTVTPTPTAAPTPTIAPEQKSEDGTAVGKGASKQSAAAAITAASSDEGPTGTSFALLQPRVKKTTKSSIRIAWAKVPGAVEYIVYGAPCGSAYKEIQHVRTNSYTQKKLKKATSYKYMVMAVSASDTVLATSKTLHIMTDGGRRGNYKSVKVNKKSVTLAKKGKTFKIKAKAVAKPGKTVKAHRKLAYESSDPAIATVSKSGKIKAVKKGKCNVFVYAADGTFAKIKVIVKK